MTNLLFALGSGLLFGLGLIVAGMSNPAKVLGFLDLAGNWDPSLAFVMVGGMGIASLAFGLVRKMSLSWLGLPLRIPGTKDIDAKLLVGSAMFGLGWGLSGICPGPAVVLLGAGVQKSVVFGTAMLAGMALFELFDQFVLARRAASDDKLRP
ncbi:putative membrane protein YedE/YeeE [Oxalobacteraceae bacterium GrIS 2.11]